MTGVQTCALPIYALRGLKAHFADTVPDYSDSSIYFITRSSDYRIKNDQKQIIGDYILNGEVITESLWRAGFMAVIDGNVQIGISRSPKIRKHIAVNSGSMFRQMALISAGTRCDEQFILNHVFSFSKSGNITSLGKDVQTHWKK